jgi:hypothetical protein
MKEDNGFLYWEFDGDGLKRLYRDAQPLVYIEADVRHFAQLRAVRELEERGGLRRAELVVAAEALLHHGSTSPS